MSLRAPIVLGCLATLVGCTSDLNAPSNYLLPDGPDTDGGDVALLCDTIPTAAVQANFSYSLELAADEERTLTYTAEGLPDGLQIDPDSGEITGQPTTEGMFSFTVTATAEEGETGTAMCDVDVAARLGLDLDAALLVAQPFCLQPNESLLDYLVPGTGDTTAVTCDHIVGSGNGNLPAGLTVNPDTCVAEGNLAETRFGTYVFAMRGQQSGVDVYMPYCATQGTANFAYDVSSVHSGEDPGTLVPIGRTYDPAAPLSVGEPGNPVFTIIDEASCGANSCFFGFSFGINASPFDAATFGLPNRDLVRDMTDRPIGFTHELTIGGAPVAAEFVDRPWVVNVSLDYCLAPDDMTCDGAANTQQNGDGHLELGVIMVPQG
jgi:hypothetical protein